MKYRIVINVDVYLVTSYNMIVCEHIKYRLCVDKG